MSRSRFGRMQQIEVEVPCRYKKQVQEFRTGFNVRAAGVSSQKRGGHEDKKKRNKWTMCLTQISGREIFICGNVLLV